MGKFLFTMGLVCLLTGCSAPHSHGPHEGDHADSHGHAHDDHGHDTVVRQITAYNQTHEFFVEHPPLVAGSPATFTLHVTQLSDWRPETAPVMSVQLSQADQKPVQVQAVRGEQAGIYTASLKPSGAGRGTLTFSVPGTIESTVSQSGIRIHADQHEADHSDAAPQNPFTANPLNPFAQVLPPATDEGEDIVYLKQQQWLAPFRTEPLTRRRFRDALSAPGRIRVRDGGEALMHAPFAGRLVGTGNHLPIFGNRVRKGQQLATLFPRFEEAENPAALALTLQQARLDHQFARRELARIKKLHAQGVAAEDTLQRAELAETEANAAQQVAKQRADQLLRLQGGANEEPVAGITLAAPIQGTVTTAHAVSGALVTEDEILWHIVDMDRLWLAVEVPEHETALVKNPQSAWFLLPGENQLVSIDAEQGGRFIGAGGTVHPQKRTVSFVFELPNPEGRLKIGMHVQAWIATGETEESWAVPAEALMEEMGQTVVYGQKNGETFSRRVVKVGKRDGNMIQILSGLGGIQRVVTRGAYGVHLAGNTAAVPDHGHAH